MITSTSKSYCTVNGQNSWEATIQAEVKKFNGDEEQKQLKKRSIYQLPPFAKMMKSATVLTPQVVSFGPYHHGNPNLMLVEGYKKTALIHFLVNAGRPLQYFIDEMKNHVNDLQACYDFLEDEWEDKDKFIELMITDGCFMLEVLRIHEKQPVKAPYATHDPIFSDHATQHKLLHIKKDMLMLENQLPLLVLKVLHQGKTDKEINNLVFKFFEMEDMLNTTPDQLGLHVLDLYRKGLIGAQTKPSAAATFINICISSAQENITQPPQSANVQMLNAMKLYQSHVRFVPSEEKKITCISFEKGILKLPYFIVDDATESTFLNLMAFEHLHVGLEDEVTSYVCFMDELIDSADDVQLLRSKKIIHTAVGSDQAAADLLNSLTKEVTHDPKGKIQEVREAVKKYSGKNLNRWLADLLHLYFETPWKTLAAVAAVLLLVLTIVQTLYAVLSYHHPSK
ncbi:HP0062-like domain-containing protein [Dioscorea alata]|uniref:HP0062-like domain-containing protein n=1 Tax=Dioscorea alata TaxID=55571 RepID=A0ACB7UTA7_DIOAL|nr:HP0062-like domain-containing protein [Dioscorea alata]